MENRDSVPYALDANLLVLERCLEIVSQAIRDAVQQSLNRDTYVIVYKGNHLKQAKTLLSLGVLKSDDLKHLIRLATAAQLSINIEASEGEGALLDVLRGIEFEFNQIRHRSMRRVVLVTANSDSFKGEKRKLNVAINLTAVITNPPALINPIFIKNLELNVSIFGGSLHYIRPLYLTYFALLDSLTKFAPALVSPESLSSSNYGLLLSKSRRKHLVLH